MITDEPPPTSQDQLHAFAIPRDRGDRAMLARAAWRGWVFSTLAGAAPAAQGSDVGRDLESSVVLGTDSATGPGGACLHRTRHERAGRGLSPTATATYGT
jgi:hypothetical protein